MKELINQESINALNKSKIFIILEIIVSLVITAGIIILLLFLTNRKIRFVMALLLALVSSIEMSFILYTLLTSLIPLQSYQKVCKNALNSNKYETNALILSVNYKTKHVKGVAVKEIKVRDVDENKEYAFYIEDNNDIANIQIGSKYLITTYQSFVVSYENL